MSSFKVHKLQKLIATVLSTALLLTLGFAPAQAELEEQQIGASLSLDSLNKALKDAEEAVEENFDPVVPELGETLSFETDHGAVTLSDGGGQINVSLGGQDPEQGQSLGILSAGGLDDVVLLDDGTTVFEGDDVVTAVQANTDGSVRTQAVLENENAPQELVYAFDAGEDHELMLADDGGIDVYQYFEGEDQPLLVSRIEAPWAVDAAGNEIPTRLEIRDGSIVQIVEHTAVDTVYPVVGDPFWVPAVIVGLRVAAQVVIKVGSRTVKYTKAPATRVVNGLKNFVTLNYKAGSHTFKLTKSNMKHILERHHPKYWNGTTKSNQTFLNPNMSINDVRSLVHSALKQHRNTLSSGGTNKRISMQGTVDGVKYQMVVDKGQVVQFYPR